MAIADRKAITRRVLLCRRRGREPAPGGARTPLPASAWQEERPLFCGITVSGALTGTSMANKIIA